MACVLVQTSLLSAAVALAGCSAVYPEVATPVKPVAAGQTLSPPPPEDLFYIRLERATIPARTRDGRSWDSVGGSAPDPFVKVMLDDRELFRTPTESDTLTPTWPDAVKANYRVPKGATLRFELWDANPINNHPICVRDVRSLTDHVRAGFLEIDCDSGAKIRVTTEPAHARFGLGMRYEFRTQAIYVTRVALESPAARAGLRAGDRIMRILGKEVASIDQETARSLINANAPTGVSLTIKKPDGVVVDVTVKDGPIYPVLEDDIPIE
jgi:membrane-associated protease RseP (regulator of RpoE activity)